MAFSVSILTGFLFVFLCSSAWGQRFVIYSGTFDPPHEGHARVITEAAREVRADNVLVVPNPTSDHKQNTSSYTDRSEMANRAFGEIPHVQFPDEPMVEAFQRNDMYGIRQIILERYPNAEIFQVMGEDSYERFLSATQNKRIPNVTVLMVKRPGSEFAIPENLGTPMRTISLSQSTDISSTQIRNAIRDGVKPEGLADDVWEYIQEKKLYLSPVATPVTASQTVEGLREGLRQEAFEQLKRELARKFPALPIASLKIPTGITNSISTSSDSFAPLADEVKAFIRSMSAQLGLQGEALSNFVAEAERIGLIDHDGVLHAKTPGLIDIGVGSEAPAPVTQMSEISLSSYHYPRQGETYHMDVNDYVSDRFPPSLVNYMNGRDAEIFVHSGSRSDALGFHRQQGYTKAYLVNTQSGFLHREIILLVNENENKVRLVLANVNGLDRQTHVLTQVASSAINQRIPVRIIQHRATPPALLNSRVAIRASDELMIGYQHTLWRTISVREEGWIRTLVSPPGRTPIELYENTITGRRIFSARPEYGDEVLTIVDYFYRGGIRDFTYVGTAGSISSGLPIGSMVTPREFLVDNEKIIIANQLRGPLTGGVHAQVPAILFESDQYLNGLQRQSVQSFEVEGGRIAQYFKNRPEARLGMGFIISDNPLGSVTINQIRETDIALRKTYEQFFDLWSSSGGSCHPTEILNRLFSRQESLPQ